ncbi:MAG: sigma-54 dependent transcriptional regulator [Acidobacteriota bacterium]
MASDATDWRTTETRQHTTAGDSQTSGPAHVPALTLLAHPDPDRVGERLALTALSFGRAIQLSRLEPAFSRPQDSAQHEPLPLAERSISRQPIGLSGTGLAGEVQVDAQATRTEVLVEGEVVAGRRVLSAAEVERGVVLQLGRRVAALLHPMLLPPPEPAPQYGLVGDSDAMVGLRHEIAGLAPLNVPVLLRGESGTGKELVARALHDGGSRSQGPYLAVNMATLSPSLAAAELFGAARGAFTGADRKKIGWFQGAHGGTLFLDEIGEMPVEVQAMLLRALENHEIMPVGSVASQKVDVRVIAATDARLEAAIAEGRFRAPLYHRLSGYTLQLPPLRQRREDIGRLLNHFFEQELAQLGAGEQGDDDPIVPPARVIARLARHDWPGNVRELRNVARRLALSHRLPTRQLLTQLEEVLTPTTPSLELHPPATAQAVAKLTPPPRRPNARRRRRKPADVSEDELLAALEAHSYRMRETAEALDLSRIGLYRRLDTSPNVRKAADLGRREIDDALEAADGDVEAAALTLRVSLQGLKRRITALG